MMTISNPLHLPCFEAFLAASFAAAVMVSFALFDTDSGRSSWFCALVFIVSIGYVYTRVSVAGKLLTMGLIRTTIQLEIPHIAPASGMAQGVLRISLP